MASRLVDGVPPRYPAREELEAEEASRQLEAIIGEFFDEAERVISAREESERGRAVPRRQVRAAAGLGKTAAVIDELARRESWRGRYVDYYVPTTKLAEELAAKRGDRGLPVRVIRGRSNGAPSNPMCAKFKAAEKAAQLGLNVFQTLCKRRQSDGRALVCRHYDTCPYIAQWQDSAPGIRIFPHAYLPLPRPRPEGRSLPKPDLVIVDESAVFSLTGHTSFGIDRLEGPALDAVRDHLTLARTFARRSGIAASRRTGRERSPPN